MYRLFYNCILRGVAQSRQSLMLADSNWKATDAPPSTCLRRNTQPLMMRNDRGGCKKVSERPVWCCGAAHARCLVRASTSPPLWQGGQQSSSSSSRERWLAKNKNLLELMHGGLESLSLLQLLLLLSCWKGRLSRLNPRATWNGRMDWMFYGQRRTFSSFSLQMELSPADPAGSSFSFFQQS